jgi:hypothetical protein
MIGIDRSAGSALIRRVAGALEEWNSPTGSDCYALCQPPADRGGLWSSRAMTASAARSPFCHAPPTVPQKV